MATIKDGILHFTDEEIKESLKNFDKVQRKKYLKRTLKNIFGYTLFILFLFLYFIVFPLLAHHLMMSKWIFIPTWMILPLAIGYIINFKKKERTINTVKDFERELKKTFKKK